MSNQVFKGIAIFTPGGDLIYGIDPSKQGHWHIDLCVVLQQLLGLSEPPHFLVPGYTATIDRWIDPQTQQLKTSAEIYPPVQKHQLLLNAVFGIRKVVWQIAPWQEESCDPMVIFTYRDRFPQLWEDHDLIVRFDDRDQITNSTLLDSQQSTAFSSDNKDLEDSINKKNHFSLFRQDPLYDRDNYISYQTTPIGLINSDTNSSEISFKSNSPLPHSYVLRLFVSGHTSATEQTLKKMHNLLENSLHYPYTIKVIDVLKHPEQAEVNQISATPTLLRVWPQPVRRIVGELNDVENILRVILALEA
ncbi:circadian clock KaiB family protein [Limnofasciculus baicalensis]|uniref:Circadian clock KaiB family protein n=1 Tax=Limnofasciculus baicalensis BBK-W-15 TaxID=2699891 RepID=A0AAE3KSG0_9CYAN|nr:circadian clock KaiB family protein [Limnofasciculus baicalensis]MCP2732598.1 circadian clock KaiB family protein [Limnofasciculus baicalensis BBK-W-15]